MQFLTSALNLLLITGFASAEQQCLMPNGTTGKCKLLKECKSLYDLNKRMIKTNDDLQYLQQSKCNDTSSHEILVCCAPEIERSNFKESKPIKYEKIRKYDETEIKPSTFDENNVQKLNSRNTDKDEDVNKWSKGNVSSQTKVAQREPECGKENSNNRIIGGSLAGTDEFPWLVLFDYAKPNRLVLCGGSLITKRFVLTAAHCLNETNAPRYARLAEYNITSFPHDIVMMDGGGFDNVTVQIVEIEKNIPHPNYELEHGSHDIGLSKLKNEVTLTDYIRLICLPSQDFMKDFKVPQTFIVAGWGSDGSKYSDVKKYVTIPYVPNEECQEVYSNLNITDCLICAGGKRGEDSCKGDSGGPLMYEHKGRYIVIGVISAGPQQCGIANYPALHTYVFQYLDWIRNTTWSETDEHSVASASVIIHQRYFCDYFLIFILMIYQIQP